MQYQTESEIDQLLSACDSADVAKSVMHRRQLLAANADALCADSGSQCFALESIALCSKADLKTCICMAHLLLQCAPTLRVYTSDWSCRFAMFAERLLLVGVTLNLFSSSSSSLSFALSSRSLEMAALQVASNCDPLAAGSERTRELYCIGQVKHTSA